MAIRHVVKEGDAILRKHCREITEITDRIRTTMEDMLETMRQEQGVGIAGPQVGVMRRMFVAEPAPGEVYFMINPEILEKEGSQTGEEGCLSVPGLVGTVERPQKIRMRAQDLDGNWQEYEFEDFHARVMCHEYDHLDGILYTDKATDIHEPVMEEEPGEEE
ncbi:peptide deformylase [Hornefia butyriciproducens]|jgi:peptide deformylase|uniref:Peptide deformylase n=1 Tax=Hornefia butyriciproducens TaxID=2652293 RepID=A0A6L5Y4M5_9FIRM|nr:peptide deformylase [Hornefia butyriciproducens]MCI7326687.1 peptide deformylase [Clostridiales bacterium]MCI7413690.1 peptide deformylase [Clostridiales bacterium]MCI7679314.1 peptide deformylase [Clostridiales bacterium]MDD6299278.1 peptide deformylase [Hornefia butyriciproducens]MDD7020625.1 peptide deformylase [Hornefia butyriciproducens]